MSMLNGGLAIAISSRIDSWSTSKVEEGKAHDNACGGTGSNGTVVSVGVPLWYQ